MVGSNEARRLFGAGMLGVEEVGAAFGFDPIAELAPPERATARDVPFDRGALERAAASDWLLVFRSASRGGKPFTIIELAGLSSARFGDVTGAWFAKEPFATVEVCRPGWALVSKEPIPDTRNLTYREQDETLASVWADLGVDLRRRRAVEIAYDVLLHAASGRGALLEKDWDWSASQATDGAWVSAGEFGDSGLRLVAYSPTVRFATLGVCGNV